MQRHGGKGQGDFHYKIYPKDPNRLVVAYYKLVKSNLKLGGGYHCFDTLHPEDQVKSVKVVARGKSAVSVLLVNSLMVIYALNNELLCNPKFDVNAFEVLKSGKMISAIKNRWIDETILGNISSDLNMELNKLYHNKHNV